MKEEYYKNGPPSNKTTTPGWTGKILANDGQPHSSRNSGKSVGTCGNTEMVSFTTQHRLRLFVSMPGLMLSSLSSMQTSADSSGRICDGFAAPEMFSSLKHWTTNYNG